MTILAVATDHTNILWSVPAVFASPSMPQFYSTVYSTDSYDKNISRGAILIQNGTSEPCLDLGAAYSEFWLHFTLDTNNPSVTGGLSLVDTYDASGNFQIAVVENATGPIYDVRKSTNGTTYGTTFAGTLAGSAVTRIAWDIHYKIHATLGEIHIYQDGVLSFVFTGNTSTNGGNAIRYVRFSGGRSIAKYLSEVVAATEDTLGWRVSSHSPVSGTQSFSGWTGNYTTIDEFDNADNDSAFANTADATSSYPVSDLDASLAGMSIKAVASCARVISVTGATTPNIDMGLVIGGTFYSGGTDVLSPTSGAVPIVNIFETNPATATTFTFSDVDALQVALRAKT
jgi:hypothetical protein